MRKSRIVLTALAVSVFAVSAGALVACGKDGGDNDNAIEITFDANGGTFTGGETTAKIATDADGKIAESALPTATRADTTDKTFTFNAWYDAASGGNAIAWDTAFTENTTVYAHWTEAAKNSNNQNGGASAVYTIKFDAGVGTVTPEQATTTDGKLTSIPTPVAPDENYVFVDWYTNEDGAGELIDTDYVFSADGTIYAYFKKLSMSKVFINTDTKALLGLNPEPPSDPTFDKEYMLEDGALALKDGDELTFTLDDKDWAENQTFDLSGNGFVKPAGATSSITISGDGNFSIYIKHYANSSDNAGWSIYIAAPEQAPKDGWYLVGSAFSWEADTSYMLKDGSLTIDLKVDDEFKVIQYSKVNGLDWNGGYNYDKIGDCDGWFEEAASDQNVKVKVAGTYEFTVDSNGALSIKKDGQSATMPEAPVDGMYLVGIGDKWGANTKYLFKNNTLTVKLGKNTQFKIVPFTTSGGIDWGNELGFNEIGSNGGWFVAGDGGNPNVKVNVAGTYTFTLSGNTVTVTCVPDVA